MRRFDHKIHQQFQRYTIQHIKTPAANRETCTIQQRACRGTPLLTLLSPTSTRKMLPVGPSALTALHRASVMLLPRGARSFAGITADIKTVRACSMFSMPGRYVCACCRGSRDGALQDSATCLSHCIMPRYHGFSCFWPLR